ncbi:MAG: hypothetical protein QOK05_2613 [Chloroflexota bacterium]|nr:hypothetical protein [Chloroflexota bacterium]
MGAASLALLLWVPAAVTAHAAGPGDAESDTRDGASAIRQLADVKGHRPDLLRDKFDLRPAQGVLFILEPETTFTQADAVTVTNWISRGGVLVYAAEASNPPLETALGISRAGSDSVFEGSAYAATPLLAGVSSARMGSAQLFASPTGPQVMFLRSAITDGVVGIEGPLGLGHYIALATPTLLDNGGLASADDNGRLAADLADAAGPSGQVIFDQYHHAGGAGESGSLAWIGSPWGFAIVLEILLVFGLLMLAGRAFGPRIPLRPQTDPSSAEFTSAVGAMLRRARARRQTVGRLLYATRVALAEQVGIRGGFDPQRLDEVLRRRSPGLADALAHATARAQVVDDERSLAQAAAELHQLAHPALGAPGVQPQTPTRRR